MYFSKLKIYFQPDYSRKRDKLSPALRHIYNTSQSIKILNRVNSKISMKNMDGPSRMDYFHNK